MSSLSSLQISIEDLDCRFLLDRAVFNHGAGIDAAEFVGARGRKTFIYSSEVRNV